MYKRIYRSPSDNFFLFGPRGSGKSTWLKNIYRPNLYIDLLRSENYLELNAEPSRLRHKVLALESGKIVVDEIQRCPELLNEVHALIEDYPKKYQFALAGSSARKLRHTQSNLLAGRALTRQFFPLTTLELDKDFDLEEALLFGTLPKSINLKSYGEKQDYLYSYTQTYLEQEIQQEALVRKLDSYHRFLKHLSLSNGNVLNLSNLSRESSVKRTSLENYMSILCDTLMGIVIEPLHLKAKVKEVSTPKFYFFDCGIVRALCGTLDEKLDNSAGNLFETLVLNELRAFNDSSRKFFAINYWGTPSQNEVDFVLSKGKKVVGIEVKYSKKWRSEFSNGLNTLLHAKKISSAIVVYAGHQEEKHGEILLMPYQKFCKSLFAGEII